MKQSGHDNKGRRGDPRMHKAVAARLANKQLSLLQALLVGGFEFPDGIRGEGKCDRNVYDSDNVLLCQRKNQLSRRLRLVRKQVTNRLSTTPAPSPVLKSLEGINLFSSQEIQLQQMQRLSQYNQNAAAALQNPPTISSQVLQGNLFHGAMMPAGQQYSSSPSIPSIANFNQHQMMQSSRAFQNYPSSQQEHLTRLLQTRPQTLPNEDEFRLHKLQRAVEIYRAEEAKLKKRSYLIAGFSINEINQDLDKEFDKTLNAKSKTHHIA